MRTGPSLSARKILTIRDLSAPTRFQRNHSLFTSKGNHSGETDVSPGEHARLPEEVARGEGADALARAAGAVLEDVEGAVDDREEDLAAPLALGDGDVPLAERRLARARRERERRLGVLERAVLGDAVERVVGAARVEAQRLEVPRRDADEVRVACARLGRLRG